MTTPPNPVPGDLAAVQAAEAKAEADQKADDAAVDAAVAKAETDEAAQTTPPPPPPTPSFTAVASGTSITVSWANVASNPTKIGRSSGGSADGGPWDTTEYSPVPTFTGTGTWTFLFLIPGALYTLTLYETSGATLTATATVPPATVTPPTPAALAITTTSLPPATVGSSYSSGLAASGGTPPYSWSLISGTLPAPMALSGTGNITGTPAGPADVPITAQVSDKSSPVQTQKASFTFIANALSTSPQPMIDSGQLPSGQSISNMSPILIVNFNQTTLAACKNTANATTAAQPAPFVEGWYGASTANQNETNMMPQFVVPTENGLELIVPKGLDEGGLVSTANVFNWFSTKQFYVEVAFIPASNALGQWLNWIELWITTYGVWVGESDLCESLGSNGTNGGMAFHIHDNNNAVSPAGINYNLNPGVINTVGCLQLPNGMRYLFVNGVYKGFLQGAAAVQSTAALEEMNQRSAANYPSLRDLRRMRLSGERPAAVSSVLTTASPWMFVLGNSVSNGAASTAQAATLNVAAARCWQ